MYVCELRLIGNTLPQEDNLELNLVFIIIFCEEKTAAKEEA